MESFCHKRIDRHNYLNKSAKHIHLVKFNIIIHMKKTILFFLLLATKFSFCQTDSLWNLDGVSNVTVMLYQKISDTNGVNGSGTVINYNGRYFLLTASHVAKQMKADANVVFRLNGDKPGIIGLLLLTKSHKLDWAYHPIADLATIELTTSDKNVEQRLKQWSFPASQIYDNTDLPKKEADLTFLGFPRIDLDLQHFSPLTFNSHLSSGLITQLRYDTKTKCNFFYLDIPSMQGCSGSGVYFSVSKAMYFGGNVTIFIGVVHGTATDDTGGKLATITPAFYIWDLLKNYK